jgi:hypothetical protein
MVDEGTAVTSDYSVCKGARSMEQRYSVLSCVETGLLTPLLLQRHRQAAIHVTANWPPNQKHHSKFDDSTINKTGAPLSQEERDTACDARCIVEIESVELADLVARPYRVGTLPSQSTHSRRKPPEEARFGGDLPVENRSISISISIVQAYLVVHSRIDGSKWSSTLSTQHASYPMSRSLRCCN